MLMFGRERTAILPPYPTHMFSLTEAITDTGRGVIDFPEIQKNSRGTVADIEEIVPHIYSIFTSSWEMVTR